MLANNDWLQSWHRRGDHEFFLTILVDYSQHGKQLATDSHILYTGCIHENDGTSLSVYMHLLNVLLKRENELI